MAKKEINPNSLANLQPEKYKFTKDNADVAKIAQEKSVAKRNENRLMKQVAAEALVKKFQGVEFQEASIKKLIEYCLSTDADIDTALRVLTFLRDTAGQKPIEQTVVAFDENNELIIDLDDED